MVAMGVRSLAGCLGRLLKECVKVVECPDLGPWLVVFWWEMLESALEWDRRRRRTVSC
jgi:hypothetical protein